MTLIPFLLFIVYGGSITQKDTCAANTGRTFGYIVSATSVSSGWVLPVFVLFPLQSFGSRFHANVTVTWDWQDTVALIWCMKGTKGVCTCTAPENLKMVFLCLVPLVQPLGLTALHGSSPPPVPCSLTTLLRRSWTRLAASSRWPCGLRGAVVSLIYTTLTTFEILSSAAVTSCLPTRQMCCVAHESLLGSTWFFRQDLLYGHGNRCT